MAQNDFFDLMDILIYGGLTIVFLMLFIFIFRFIGAWMLRIDEIISLLKKILRELERSNKNFHR